MGISPKVKVVVAAALLLRAMQSFADDPITQFSSPIVSYQNAEVLSSEALTSGGVQSPIVSYQNQDNLASELLVSTGIASPIYSYQYLEWPGGNVLGLQSSPWVSYYYQPLSLAPSGVLHGRVTDTGGSPLSGATVAAFVGLNQIATATTDANGTYQISSLASGVYDLWAVDAQYQTSIRSLTLNANTAEQNFQLLPLPLPPTVQQTSRQPNLSATIGLMGSALRIFDGTQFQAITLDNAPSSDKMTVVLTHGWNSDPSVWAQEMAGQMWAHGISTNVANIVAWDWHAAAAGTIPPEENTPPQGVALGQALLGALGPSYSKPIHFIGHSLGTMVNASAANYLHGDRIGQQDISPTPWNIPVHVTLLDQAEASWILASFVNFNGTSINIINPSSLATQSANAFGWKSATPIHLAWADNYVSEFGFYHPDAINVTLKEASSFLAPVAAHAYSYQWYGWTVDNPSDCILGFQRSYEAQLANLAVNTFPPAEADFPFGVSYVQPATAPDPLSLIFQQSFSGQPLGNFAEQIVQVSSGTIYVAGNVAAQVNSVSQSVNQYVNDTFTRVTTDVENGGEALVSISRSSAVLALSLTTGPGTGNQTMTSKMPKPFGLNGQATSNAPPMAWVPVAVPSDQAAMVFDFSVSGNPGEDALVCGIGTNNLFSLQAKYIPTNAVSTTRLIDVSQWAGTTNEFFFGFLGGTSTNAVLQIDNIRFYSVLPPMLNVSITNNSAVLSWPLWANGFTLQSTDNLTNSNSWVDVGGTPAIVGSQFTMTNQANATCHLFRLKQSAQ